MSTSSGSGDKADISSRLSSSTASTPSKANPSPTPSTSKGGSMGSEQKFSSSSREMRNLAEKMRRDKLNNYVTELAGIVPLGTGANKRVDKTSILRLAANYIRMHKFLKDEEEEGDRLPSIMRGNLSNTLAEAVGGFLLVVTSSGKVVYVTEAVEQFFGHSQVDLLGHSIYNVIHPDDHEIVQQQLQAKENTRRSFFCRMMEKALSRNDPGRYEIIHIVGQMKPLPQTGTPVPSPSTSVPSPDSGSSKHGDDEDDEELDGDVQSLKVANRIGTHMLVSFVRVVKDRPITELSLVESTQEEYITRHGTDGKILYTDHRISFVTGLMPSEVLGTSAFTYMHKDDMVWSVVAQKLMLSSSQGQGVVSYRLKCKDGTYVTLRTRGFLEFNKQKEQVDSFVCINTVMSVKDAAAEIRNQRRSLLPMITSQDSDEHLNTVTATCPPDMLMLLKQMMNPDVIQKMINSVDETLDTEVVPSAGISAQGEMTYPSARRSESDYQWEHPVNKKTKVHHQDSQFNPSASSFGENTQNVQFKKDTLNFSEVNVSNISSPDEPFTQESTKKFTFQKDFNHPRPMDIEHEVRIKKTVVRTFVPVSRTSQMMPTDYHVQKGITNFSSAVGTLSPTGNICDGNSDLSLYVQQPSPNLLSPEGYPPSDSVAQQIGSPNILSPMQCDQLGSNLQNARYLDKKGIPSPGQFDQKRSGSMPSPGSCDILSPSQCSGMNVSPNPYHQRSQNVASNYYDQKGTSVPCSSQYNPCIGSVTSPNQYDQRGGTIPSDGQHEGNVMPHGLYDQRGARVPFNGQYEERVHCLPEGTLCPPGQYVQKTGHMPSNQYMKTQNIGQPRNSSMVSAPPQDFLESRSFESKSNLPVTSGGQSFESQMQMYPKNARTQYDIVHFQQQQQHFPLDKQLSKPVQSMGCTNMGYANLTSASEFNMQMQDTSHLRPHTSIQHQVKSNHQNVPVTLNHIGEGNGQPNKSSQMVAGRGNNMALQYSAKLQPNTSPRFDPAMALMGSNTLVPVTLSEINQSKRQYQHSSTK